jgi:diadenosine tetraphosphate (Ap4A) HIT family hydrolase
MKAHPPELSVSLLYRAGRRGTPHDRCRVCADGRPERLVEGLRVFSGALTDAYLGQERGLSGETTVFWRGRHVTRSAELSDDEATGFWLEVLHVERALEERFRPGRLRLVVPTEAVQHLRVRIIPEDSRPLAEEGPRSEWLGSRYDAEIQALRRLLAV